MKYLVMAYRYGTNDYFFPVGIFNDRKTAMEGAKHHRDFRGGKYDHKLFSMEENMLHDAEEANGEWITGRKLYDTMERNERGN